MEMLYWGMVVGNARMRGGDGDADANASVMSRIWRDLEYTGKIRCPCGSNANADADVSADVEYEHACNPEMMSRGDVKSRERNRVRGT